MSKKTLSEELDGFDWLSLLPAPPTPEQRAEWEALQARERAAEHNRRARQLTAEDRWKQRQRDLPVLLRQQAIDAVWEQTLEAKRELEEEAAQSFHRGPGDPDYRK